MELRYYLSDEALNAQFIARGDRTRRRSIEVDTAALSDEQRALLVAEWDDAPSRDAFDLPPMPAEVYSWGNIAYKQNWVQQPITSADEWFELLKQVRQVRAEMEQKAADIRAENERKQAAERAAADEHWRQSEAEKASAEAEKAAWIAAHGSARLKRAHAAGYDCGRLYLRERAAVEYPGFTLDYENAAAWKRRACPSERALNIETETRAAHPEADEVYIVWMTAPPADTPNDDEYDDEYEAREAVVVKDRRYAGRDLVMPLEP